MGCYDDIVFKCPVCNRDIYAQSKGGECRFDTFDHTFVPICTAMDANRHSPYECCGKFWAFGNIPEYDNSRVNLTVVDVTEETIAANEAIDELSVGEEKL